MTYCTRSLRESFDVPSYCDWYFYVLVVVYLVLVDHELRRYAAFFDLEPPLHDVVEYAMSNEHLFVD